MNVVRRALLVFIPLALVATGVMLLFYRAQVSASVAIAKAGEERVVTIGRQRLLVALGSMVSDLRLLTTEPDWQRWLVEQDPRGRQDIELEYAAFADAKAIYDRVRFIGLDGRELVRVNWSERGARIASQGELRDQSQLDYVRSSLELAPREIYISPFDLDVEGGAIEEPIKPMLRFGAAAYDAAGQKRGIVVLDYLGRYFLDRVRVLGGSSRGSLWLLNAEGYWLRGPSAEEEWAFMYPDRLDRNMSVRYPEIWTQILRGADSGQFSIDGSLVTFARMDPRSAMMQDGFDGSIGASSAWILVSYVPEDAILANAASMKRNLILAGIALLMLFAAASGLVARYWTQQIEADRAMKKLAERLQHDNLELDALNKELESFSYAVSHDLRAPLRAIDGFSQALIEDAGPQLDQASHGHLTRIRQAAQRMGMLIDDLLKLARVTRAELEVSRTDLSATAASVVGELRRAAPQRAVDISIAPGLSVDGDPTLLGVVLENLLSNAWKFTGKVAAPRIEFGRIERDGKPVYFVRDNGAGFDMAYAAKLFGAFQRLHDNKDYPGTGVGLATVQRIIRKHGGQIWAEAAVGRGATFYFTF